MRKDGTTRPSAAYLGLILTFVLWGSLYVVTKLLVTALPAFSVAFVRFFVAWLALRAYGRLRGGDAFRPPRGDRAYWRAVLLMGVGGYAISVGFQLLGTKIAGSTMASLINSLNPVTISVMAVFILGEPLTARKIAGIILSIFGVYLIVGLGGAVNLVGVGLSLLAVLGWSLISVLSRKGVSKYGALPVTRDAIGVAALCNLAFCLAESVQRGSLPAFTPLSLLGLAYMGVCCTALTYILWNWALSVLPASNCSALYPIQPLTSALLGILVFGERITLSFALGTACIVGGILICLLGGEKRAKE